MADGMGDATTKVNGHATSIPNGVNNHDERAPGAPATSVNGTDTNGHGTRPDAEEHTDADDDTAESPGQSTSLLSLPPELLDVVLAHVPPAQKLSTVRSLSLVLPYSVSRRWRWEHLVLTSPRQFYPLYNALARERERRVKELEEGGRSAGRGGDELVRTLCVECWKGDVDMLNK